MTTNDKLMVMIIFISFDVKMNFFIIKVTKKKLFLSQFNSQTVNYIDKNMINKKNRH